jgi:hypothetical protein
MHAKNTPTANIAESQCYNELFKNVLTAKPAHLRQREVGGNEIPMLTISGTPSENVNIDIDN